MFDSVSTENADRAVCVSLIIACEQRSERVGRDQTFSSFLAARPP
jgi:hypothetical protein